MNINMPKDNIQQKIDFYMPTEPDQEMLIWEKWIQIRKEETTHLGKKLRRPPIDLAMNLTWNVREDRERKIALEHAQIKRKPTLRNALWEQAPRLKQECYCKPVYEIHRTPAEMGHPSVVEHINVPTYIKVTEMGMAGDPERKPCPQLNADYVKYREKREHDLKNKLKKIDPFRPLVSELVLKGAKPVPPPPKLPPLPNITISEPNFSAKDALSGVYAVRINNTVFFKDVPDKKNTHLHEMQTEQWHETCTSWTYYFNVPVTRAGRARLFIHNLGTVTLRFCWKKIKRSIPFIPEDIYEQVFFFNKNEDVIPPGQSKTICFTFVSDKSGIYSEAWELTFCNICFFDSLSEKLIINLSADSFINAERIKRKVDLLKMRINRKAIISMVSVFIKDAFDKVFATVPQFYPYKKLFLEGQIFVMKNPVCFYHQTEVARMKELYMEIEPDQTWNLSISTWREKMMAKDYDDRMKYYELLRKSHTALLQPWYEGEELRKQKYRAVKLILQQLANKLDKEYARLREKTRGKIIQRDSVTSSHKFVSKNQEVQTIDPLAAQNIQNLFYIHAYEHVATTIELCAGVLSSLDMDRWIEFDFCRL